MRVLLLGSTGNVGSRLLSSLLAYNHTPILYLRTPSKLPQSVLTSLPSSSIVTGSATDSSSIAGAIRDHNCDAVVSAAGLAKMFSKTKEFPAIFRAVVTAAATVGKERSKPVRCWMLGGMGALEIPERIVGKKGVMLASYLPFFPDHYENYALLQSMSENEVAWSMLCASAMSPSKEADPTAEAKANSRKIVATADVPPEWTDTLSWVPLFGRYLNVFANAGRYMTTLEQAVEVVVRDLDSGLESDFVNRRVGFRVAS